METSLRRIQFLHFCIFVFCFLFEEMMPQNLVFGEFFAKRPPKENLLSNFLNRHEFDHLCKKTGMNSKKKEEFLFQGTTSILYGRYQDSPDVSVESQNSTPRVHSSKNRTKKPTNQNLHDERRSPCTVSRQNHSAMYCIDGQTCSCDASTRFPHLDGGEGFVFDARRYR